MLRTLPMRAYLALSSLRDRQDGQAMVEYALVLFLVAVVSVGILSALGQHVSAMFSVINKEL